MSTNVPASPPSWSAVVLAGGASRRMGRDKRLLLWGRNADGTPRTLLRAVVDRLAMRTEDVVVVANDSPDAGPARVVPDAYPGAGSLGGIYSGVAAASHEVVFVAGADMPFLNLDLIHYLLDRLGPAGAVVPVIDGRLEPLHAVYRRSLLGPARERILAGDLKIAPLFQKLRVVWVREPALRAIDSELASFRNLNTPADYERARAETQDD